MTTDWIVSTEALVSLISSPERLSSGSALPNSSCVSFSMRGSSASGTPITSMMTCSG